MTDLQTLKAKLARFSEDAQSFTAYVKENETKLQAQDDRADSLRAQLIAKNS